MLSVPGDADNVRIIFFNDDQTPWDFVIDLLWSVFGHSNADAEAFAAKGDRRGKAAFGSYPADMADRLLQAARKQIEESGHPLTLRSERVGDSEAKGRCDILRRARLA